MTEPKTFSRLILSKPVLQLVGACRKEWFVLQPVTGEQSSPLIQGATPELPLAMDGMIQMVIAKTVGQKCLFRCHQHRSDLQQIDAAES